MFTRLFCDLCHPTRLKLFRSVDCNKFRYYHSENVFGFKKKTRNCHKVLTEKCIENRCKDSNFYRLVKAFREHGHKYSDINPVSLASHSGVLSHLDLKTYGLIESDRVSFEGIINHSKNEGTISEATDFLNEVYTKNVAAEFLYLENEEEIEWLSEKLEQLPRIIVDDHAKIQIATELLKSQSFDNFLAKKFPSLKRYGGEGAEAMMSFYIELFKLASQNKVEQIVLAMAHRGRMNILTGMLNFPPALMFKKLKGNPDFPQYYKATGDVLSHCISSTNIHLGDELVHVSLLYNPSHLEAVNPVSMGKTRAKQMLTKDGDYGDNCLWGDKIINVQVHGDAALMGQGVNQECLALSSTPHFQIGGTIHLVINNQVGFTTPAARGRSSRYSTDVAKIIAAPVIHVNGDYPEDVLKVTKLAFDYHRKFRKDIFIDLNCYRQWGHNELDDPTFTNPALYNIIRSRKTVPDLYAEKLINEGIIPSEQCQQIVVQHQKWLTEHLDAADKFEPEDTYFNGNWKEISQAEEAITTWNTGVDFDMMTFVGSKSVHVPEHFELHPTLSRTHVKNRITKISEGINIDWSTAECLAIGSLLLQDYNVRISGQDVGRGTFSHRHAMLVDQKSNNIWIPLNNLHSEQTSFLEIANSILSEEAVLGYEYGMSVETPANLIIWEAQFGDFFNGAQIIFDTFITSGENKWLWQSGLTILLPHGYDGAGPEHSSCRIERFLQLTDSNENKPDGDNINMQVCQPSTPAQYFHLLRRQMMRNFRKPLIIITPKMLLRHASCVSGFSDMAPGTYFKPVLGDQLASQSQIKKVLITSGKHYYSLLEKRESMGVKDTAIIRVESFCPFPTLELRQEIAKYPNTKVIIWCQEEPRNMGAWTFFKPRFENLIGRKVLYSGRDTSAAPAVGVGKWHQMEVAGVISEPFSMNPDE